MNFLTSDGKALLGNTFVTFKTPHSAMVQNGKIYFDVSGDSDVARLWVKVYSTCYPNDGDAMAAWLELWTNIPLCAKCEERLEDGDVQNICASCQRAMEAE